MTQAQKVIKYFAYALAIFIIISIFSLVIEIVRGVSGIYIEEDVKNEQIEYDNYLILDLTKADLHIKTGDLLKAESDNKNINIKQDGNKLVVKDKKGLFLNKNKTVVNITVPENFEFDYVKIDTGAGNINIERLKSRVLNLDMGAGKLNINDITVNKEANVDTGAGEVIINNAFINKLDLDLGAGKTEFSGIIVGSADIDTGVGNFVMNLRDRIDNYTFDLNKGIGNILVNGDQISTDSKVSNGSVNIEIDGGIGNIEINTKY